MTNALAPKSLKGYELRTLIHESENTLVYLGIRRQDSLPVVIKLMRRDYPTFAEIVRFRNQYLIAKQLDIPEVVAPLALESYHHGLALVMSDEGYISLDRRLPQLLKKDLPNFLESFFKIALQLARINNQLCQARVIHKDIKPHNILIHPQTSHVKLIDFSLASLLPKEQQEIANPNLLEGTLAYLSPEQTGRMNRGIDYRSDFYSLGITFYELLTGQLPFESQDFLEIIHCHIAKLPPAPEQVNPAIPTMVSDIVMKLMAKAPENRYQSASGLQYDLENCQQQWQNTGQVNFFELGTQDVYDHFIIPEKLYGRQTQVQQLFDAFERVSNGTTEIILVAGFSGIGKTAIINEVHKPIVYQHGYFIKGKFDQFQRDIPFSAFVQAFRSLINQLLTETDTRLSVWRSKLLEALGHDGQVIIEVIPELEKIIGGQPLVTPLSSSSAQNRFNLLFRKFIQVFTTQEHPLFIFLDDLQWVDSASLKLIRLLAEETDSQYLLLIGAYRDSEVSTAHPLALTLNQIYKTNFPINTITLSPLHQQDLNQLIADTLHCSIQVAMPLSDLVYQKTGGNPFFITQFLKALYRDGLITFDYVQHCWQCDVSQIRSLATSEDVVEFVAERLKKLNLATQEALSLAACVGNTFDTETLAKVQEKTQFAVVLDLWSALKEGLVLPTTKIYKFYTDETTNIPELVNSSKSSFQQDLAHFRFLHDRVQQAAYSLIPKSQHQQTHLKIGRLLSQGTSESELDDQLFSIVNQLNLGRALLKVKAEKIELAAMNLKAAQKAKLSTAYAAAAEYLKIAMELLPETTWQSHYSLTYAIYQERAEIEYLVSNFSQAETLYEVVLTHAQTALDQVNIYLIQVNQYQIQGRYTEAIEVQRKGLELLGWAVPLDPKQLEKLLESGIQTVNQYLQSHQIEDLISAPRMQNPEKIVMTKVLQRMFYSGYLIGNQTLANLALVKMTTISLEYGNSEISSFGYVGYGLVIEGLLQDYQTGYRFGKMATELCEQFENSEVKCQTNFLFAADVMHWSAPIKDVDPYYETTYRYGMESGDWVTIGYIVIQSGSARITRGKNLSDLYQISQAHLDFMHQVKNHDIVDILYAGVIQPIRNLQGLTNSFKTLDDIEFKEEEYLKKYADLPYYLAWIYHVKLRIAYLFNDRESWPELLSKLEIIENYVPSHTKVPEVFFYASLMRLSLFEPASETEQQQHVQHLNRLEEKLQLWAKACPENIEHKLLLVLAEKSRISGRSYEAMELYDQAITKAKEHEYIHEEALANELAGKFYLTLNREKIARVYLTEAYYCYGNWEAQAKVQDLITSYPDHIVPITMEKHPTSLEKSIGLSALKISRTSSSQTSSQSINQSIDLLSILKASQILISELDFSQLIRTLTKIVLENSGATRNCLILQRDDQLLVEASSSVDSDSVEVLQSIPLESYTKIPISIVNQVARTQEVIVLDDTQSDEAFIADRYILEMQPASILCLPLLKQTQLIGVLYLENSEMSKVFTPDRVSTLTILATQAAISLENAQLLERQKQSEAEVRRALAREQELSDLKSRFITLTSHEFRTPLSVISSSAGILKSFGYKLSDHQKLQHLEKIQSYVQHTTQLLDDILMINRVEAGKLEFNPSPIDLCHFCQTLVDEIQTMNQSHTVLFSYASVEPQETNQIKLDQKLLQQILSNLLSNAVKYSPQGGKVDLSVRVTAQTVIFRVTDQGIGIPLESQASVFEAFSRAENAGNIQGTGLGLSIVEKCVELHRGEIEFISEVDQGSAFTVTLPIGLYPSDISILNQS
ncbi:MAG: AAA family ATPase [Microcoleaceae cyanobacterium]